MEQSTDSVPFSPSIKIAGLWKRSQGLSWIGSHNYKHRVFILTDQVLSYYSGTVDRIGQLKRRIPIETIRAIEFVSESAFNLAHMFQIVYSSKKYGFITLYVITRDKSECADWVSSLRNACYFNQDMLMHYHPGILIKNKWNCCHQSGKNALGCQPSYHLLTRSSSRYAQMRRKDTLHSVYSKSSSGHQGDNLRRSTVCSERPENERLAKLVAVSNSCVNLTSCTPNIIESSAVQEMQKHTIPCVCTPSAQEACTIPSVHSSTVGNKTASESSHTSSLFKDGHEGSAPNSSPAHNDPLPHSNGGMLHKGSSYLRNSIGAPGELTPNITHFVLGHGSGGHHRSSEPLACSTASIPSCIEAGPKYISSSLSATWWGIHPYKKAGHLSSSLSSLPKPIIEPKISNSDPTVFHV